MSVPKKQKPDTVKQSIEKVIEQIEDLLKKNFNRFEGVLGESEGGKAKWTFTVLFDYSESEGIIETTSTFTESFKDKRTSKVENPNQGKLPLDEKTD